MPSAQHQQHTSSSDSDPQRKRKRMLSNRDSARRSRMRKQQHIDGLASEAARLRSENGQLALRVALTAQQCAGLGNANAVLRAQLFELTDRLQSVNSVLRFMEEFGGAAMDFTPELIPDPLLKPWQLPCPSQAILTSPDTFLY